MKTGNESGNLYHFGPIILRVLHDRFVSLQIVATVVTTTL